MALPVRSCFTLWQMRAGSSDPGLTVFSTSCPVYYRNPFFYQSCFQDRFLKAMSQLSISRGIRFWKLKVCIRQHSCWLYKRQTFCTHLLCQPFQPSPPSSLHNRTPQRRLCSTFWLEFIAFLALSSLSICMAGKQITIQMRWTEKLQSFTNLWIATDKKLLLLFYSTRKLKINKPRLTHMIYPPHNIELTK